MAPVRSIDPDARFDGDVWDVNLSPATFHRPQNGKSARPVKINSGSPDPESVSELKFVTTTGPPSERSKESRLMVRSHAMQAFLREKKLDGKTPTRKEPEVTVQSLDESIGRFKLASWSRKSSKKTSFATKDEGPSKKEGNNNGAKDSKGRPKTVAQLSSPVRESLQLVACPRARH
jgi:hypothetical protein